MTRTATTTGDFHDGLAPMLVKELRQGLRTNTFVVVFLVLQALLALILLTTAWAADPEEAGQTISGIIFLCFSLTVLVVQPLRGISAISSEINGDTLDLIVLTRLTAWRIVLGKWSALVGQSALLFTAIIPYLILRYFFGGMNLFGELMLFVLIFLGSMLLTALTVSISANQSVFIRGLLPVLASPFLIYCIFGFTRSRELHQLVDLCTFTEVGAKSTLLFLLTNGFSIGFMVLSFATSRIAPAAENHATARRLLSFVFFGTVALFGHTGGFAMESMCLVALVHCSLAITSSLAESETLLPPILEPFVRRGIAGRLFGRFFYPGWAAGSFYTLLFLASVALLLWNHARLHGLQAMGRTYFAMMIGLVGSLVFPAVILSFCGGKVKNRTRTYLLLLAGSTLLTLNVSWVAKTTDSKSLPLWIIWNPSSSMILADSPANMPNYKVLSTAITVNSTYIIILLFTAAVAFRKLTGMENQLLAGLPVNWDTPPTAP